MASRATDVERFSGTAGGCRDILHVLDKVPDVDSRLDKADEILDEDAVRIPDTPRGATTPEAMKAGGVRTVPIGRMPVRSF